MRHGEVDKTTRHHSLSAEGWQNSVAFGNYLKRQKDFPLPQGFCSSDRARSIETGRIILMTLDQDQAGLKVDEAFGEFNPPEAELEEVEKTERYQTLKNEGKRSSLYFDWTGKREAVQAYLEALERHSTTLDDILIVSHANILNFILFSLFPDDSRVQKNIETPNLSLTILEKENSVYSLRQICSLDWKNK